MFKGLTFKRVLKELSFHNEFERQSNDVLFNFNENTGNGIISMDMAAVEDDEMRRSLDSVAKNYNVRKVIVSLRELSQLIGLRILVALNSSDLTKESFEIVLNLLDESVEDIFLKDLVTRLKQFPRITKFKINYSVSLLLGYRVIYNIKELLKFASARVGKSSNHQQYFEMSIIEHESSSNLLEFCVLGQSIVCSKATLLTLLNFSQSCSSFNFDPKKLPTDWKRAKLLDSFTNVVCSMKVTWHDAMKFNLVPREYRRIRLDIEFLPFFGYASSAQRMSTRILYAHLHLSRRNLGKMDIELYYPSKFLRLYFASTYKYSHEGIKQYLFSQRDHLWIVSKRRGRDFSFFEYIETILTN